MPLAHTLPSSQTEIDACRTQPVRADHVKGHQTLKKAEPFRGEFLLNGNPSRTAWIYSASNKGTGDGTDKCFVRWMWLKTENSADLVFHGLEFTIFFSLHSLWGVYSSAVCESFQRRGYVCMSKANPQPRPTQMQSSQRPSQGINKFLTGLSVGFSAVRHSQQTLHHHTPKRTSPTQIEKVHIAHYLRQEKLSDHFPLPDSSPISPLRTGSG